MSIAEFYIENGLNDEYDIDDWLRDQEHSIDGFGVGSVHRDVSGSGGGGGGGSSYNGGKKHIACPVCKKTFKNIQSMSDHLRSKQDAAHQQHHQQQTSEAAFRAHEKVASEKAASEKAALKRRLEELSADVLELQEGAARKRNKCSVASQLRAGSVHLTRVVAFESQAKGTFGVRVGAPGTPLEGGIVEMSQLTRRRLRPTRKVPRDLVPEDLVSVGDAVWVRVLSLHSGPAGKTLRLSMKDVDQCTGRLLPAERELPARFEIVRGHVAEVKLFGVFVDLPGFRLQGARDPVTGLLHRANAGDVDLLSLAVGAQLWMKVLRADGASKRVALSAQGLLQTDGRDLDPGHVIARAWEPPDVEFVGELTREERDRVGWANAITIDSDGE